MGCCCAKSGPDAELLAAQPPSPPPAPVPRANLVLEYQSDFDDHGVLHYLGTQGGTREYQNPHQTGAVMTDVSSKLRSYAAHRFVQHEPDGESNGTHSDPNASWMKVMLGSGARLEPDHYCLRHGGAAGDNVLRNWELQGSNDGSEWVTLRKHEDDDSLLLTGFSTASWPVEARGAFAQFRVFQTDENSDGNHSLACAGIELWGALVSPSA